MISLMSLFVAFTCTGSAFAMEAEGLDLLEPTVDLDYVVVANDQIKTVTASLSFLGDFGITPVQLIGNGVFGATISRTTDREEREFFYLLLIGFGDPNLDFDINVAPATVRVNSTIPDAFTSAIGVLIHGVLFSLAEPPFDYTVSLTF
jgi:hypothetical protein